MKAVSIYTVFIIAVIGIFFTAILVVIWNYINIQTEESMRAGCMIKLENYCYRWISEKKEPGNWEEIEPKGCEKFGITKPTKEYCEKLVEFVK